MAFYEFTSDENRVFEGLAIRMTLAGALMVLFGIGMVVFGMVAYPWSLTLALIMANGVILGSIGYLTFQSAKRFRKIVETEGHDIMYLMEAMVFQNRVYALIVALVAFSVLAMIASAMFVDSG